MQFHQNSLQTEMTVHRPFTTQFPDLLDSHEKWVKDLVQKSNNPNGQDVVEAIMSTVKDLFKQNDRGGNIMIKVSKDKLNYKVTDYPLFSLFG